MYKICKTERSMERQKLFEKTLLSMMEKEIYQNITVTALCKKMQIPRKTFYRYFDTLEDVLMLMIDETLTGAFLHLEVTTDLTGFFTYWKENHTLLDAMEKSGISHRLMEQLYLRLYGGQVLKKNPSDKELKYSGWIAALMIMLLMWHHSGMERTPEEMSSLVKETFNQKL